MSLRETFSDMVVVQREATAVMKLVGLCDLIYTVNLPRLTLRLTLRLILRLVGADKLGDGLAGRSSPVLEAGDGRRDHLSVGGMVR